MNKNSFDDWSIERPFQSFNSPKNTHTHTEKSNQYVKTRDERRQPNEMKEIRFFGQLCTNGLNWVLSMDGISNDNGPKWPSPETQCQRQYSLPPFDSHFHLRNGFHSAAIKKKKIVNRFTFRLK